MQNRNLLAQTKTPSAFPPRSLFRQPIQDSNLEMTESESAALPFGEWASQAKTIILIIGRPVNIFLLFCRRQTEIPSDH